MDRGNILVGTLCIVIGVVIVFSTIATGVENNKDLDVYQQSENQKQLEQTMDNVNAHIQGYRGLQEKTNGGTITYTGFWSPTFVRVR